jgi:hypothetical protein
MTQAAETRSLDHGMGRALQKRGGKMRPRATRFAGLVLCVVVVAGMLGGMTYSTQRSHARETCVADVKLKYTECLDHLKYLRLSADLVNAFSNGCRSRFEQDTAACTVR